MNANSSSSSSSRNSQSTIVRVKIDQISHRVPVKDPDRDSLGSICQLAIILHVKRILALDQIEASELVKNENLQPHTVSDEGDAVDLDFCMTQLCLTSESTVVVTMTEASQKILLKKLQDKNLPVPYPDTSQIDKSRHGAVTVPPPSLTNPEDCVESFTEGDLSSEAIILATKNFSERVGKGGQAEVFKGVLFGTTVAVKKFLGPTDSNELAQLKQEFKILQKVKHPNIIILMGCCPELKCIVCEFMDGGSLRDRLRSREGMKAMSWADRIRIASDIVSAVMYLHGRKILHRDLKPDNILFTKDGLTKVADMGLAKSSLDSRGIASHSGAGTLRYYDPHFIHKGEISTSADIYAIGLMLLEMCVQWSDMSTIETVHKVLEEVEGHRCSEEGVSAMKKFIHPYDQSVSASMADELVRVGLNCVERHPDHRPTLSAVLARLQGEDITSSLMDQHISAPDLYNLALCYKNGEGVPLDLKMAVQLFTKAANQGDAAAQYHLGYCYHNGEGVAMDKKKAVELYTKAADKGHAGAQTNLGLCYEYGKGVLMDKKKAVEVYTKAAHQGNASAQFNLGVCYERGEGVLMDKKKAVELFTKAAEQGHPAAQTHLGLCYDYGKGVSMDKKKAVELYTKAAVQGNVGAQTNLGVCYERGEGVSMNKKKAVELYTKAADQGNALSQFNLGGCYERGDGVWMDKRKAVELYTKAADQEHPAAQTHLGLCYEYGKGVWIDKKKAVELYTKAADQGHRVAQTHLGLCYEYGKGVLMDKKKAVELYTMAADQEHPAAQTHLGLCYEYGKGVSMDKKKAFELYTNAAVQGHVAAQDYLAKLTIGGGLFGFLRN